MSSFFVKPVVRPRDLNGQENGRLAPHLLRPAGPRAGWVLHHLAARAWDALRAAALRDGIVLSYSGNPYRDYAGQVALFRDRYRSTVPTKLDRTGRVWDGVRYYRTSGAPCAVPGTSNHGWGLAVDVAVDADGDAEFEWPPKSLDARALEWMKRNIDRFGFSWEGRIGSRDFENWHIRYVAGDRVPQAVLDHEQGTVTPPPAPTPDPLAEVAAAIARARTYILRLGSGGKGASAGEVEAVKWCQILLTQKGFRTTVDGAFGPGTDRQVRAFQTARRLTVDGVVGPRTWNALVG